MGAPEVRVRWGEMAICSLPKSKDSSSLEGLSYDFEVIL